MSSGSIALAITVACVLDRGSYFFFTHAAGLDFQFGNDSVIVMACLLNYSRRVFFDSKRLSML